MGNSRNCENLGSEANYMILDISMNTLPTSMKMGVCLPAACNQHVVSKFEKKAHGFM
jgi:hypothetical protein